MRACSISSKIKLKCNINPCLCLIVFSLYFKFNVWNSIPVTENPNQSSSHFPASVLLPRRQHPCVSSVFPSTSQAYTSMTVYAVKENSPHLLFSNCILKILQHYHMKFSHLFLQLCNISLYE